VQECWLCLYAKTRYSGHLNSRLRACRSQGRHSHGVMVAGVSWEPGQWPGRNVLEEGLQK
jgi:hypothetical protein